VTSWSLHSVRSQLAGGRGFVTPMVNVNRGPGIDSPKHRTPRGDEDGPPVRRRDERTATREEAGTKRAAAPRNTEAKPNERAAPPEARKGAELKQPSAGVRMGSGPSLDAFTKPTLPTLQTQPAQRVDALGVGSEIAMASTLLDSLIARANELAPTRPPTVAPAEELSPAFAPGVTQVLLPLTTQEKKALMSKLATAETAAIDVATQEKIDTVVRDETHTKDRVRQEGEKRVAQSPEGKKALAKSKETAQVIGDIPVVMPPDSLRLVEDSLSGLLSMPGVSIETLIQLVMFEIQQSANDDVKALLEEVQANNAKKEAMREYNASLASMRAEMNAELRSEYDRRCALPQGDPMWIDPNLTSFESFADTQTITLSGSLQAPGESIPTDAPSFTMGPSTSYAYPSAATPPSDASATTSTNPTNSTHPTTGGTQQANNAYGLSNGYFDALNDYWSSLGPKQKTELGGSLDAFCTGVVGLPSDDPSASVEAYFAQLGQEAAPASWERMPDEQNILDLSSDAAASVALSLGQELIDAGLTGFDSLMQNVIAATLAFQQASCDEENSNLQSQKYNELQAALSALDGAIQAIPDEQLRADACYYFTLRATQVTDELSDARADFLSNFEGHGDKLDTDKNDYYDGLEGRSDILGGTFMDGHNADNEANGHRDRNEVVVETSYVTAFGHSEMLIDEDACNQAALMLNDYVRSYSGAAAEEKFGLFDEDTLDVVQAFNNGAYRNSNLSPQFETASLQTELVKSTNVSLVNTLRMSDGSQAEETRLRQGAAAAAAPTSITIAELDANIEAWTGAKDSLSELGDELSLKLQMAMDRLSQIQSTLSNTMKKLSDTASGIIANMK
jgi:hypothetical protein